MSISFRSKDFLVSDFTITPKKIDAHIHKYYEFLRFKHGDAVYIVDGKTFSLSPGCIVITRPNVLHAISFNSDSDYDRTFIQLSPNILSQIPQVLVKHLIKGFPEGILIIRKETAEEYKLYDFFERAVALLEVRNEKTVYLAKLLMLEFAVAIDEAVKHESHSEYSETESSTLTRIKSYIDEKYLAELNLDELADEMFVSKYHICHLFKSQLGITVLDYVALKRISAVKERIANGCNITDAYTHCGFNDYSSFYRAVKKYTGLKPSEFYK